MSNDRYPYPATASGLTAEPGAEYFPRTDADKLEAMAAAGACVASYTRRKREVVKMLGLPRTDPPKRGDGNGRLRSFIDSL